MTQILAWADGRGDMEIARPTSMPHGDVGAWRARLTDEQTAATPDP